MPTKRHLDNDPTQRNEGGGLELDQRIIDDEIIKNALTLVRIHQAGQEFVERYIDCSNLKATIETLKKEYDQPLTCMDLRYVIKYGNKYCMITIDLETNEAEDYLVNMEGEEKKPNQTTCIAAAGKKLMQQTADELGISINYTLKTSYKHLIAWAQDDQKGRAIYGWPKKPDKVTMEGNCFNYQFEPKSDEQEQ